jgi:hypothetical protein
MRSRASSNLSLEAFILAILPPEPPPVDIRFENHGSIFLIRGVSDAGQTWLDENVGDDETQHFGDAIVAEPRYVADITCGAVEAGLVVR